MPSKFKQALQMFVEDRLNPYKNLVGPEQLTITGFSGGVGEAHSKQLGTRVSVTSVIDLRIGSTVVAIPLGGAKFHAVGVIS